MGVGDHCHGRCGAAEAVPDAAVVFCAADENADGLVVVIAAEDVVNEGDVEVQFADVFGLELSGLQFDDDAAGCLHQESAAARQPTLRRVTMQAVSDPSVLLPNRAVKGKSKPSNADNSAYDIS